MVIQDSMNPKGIVDAWPKTKQIFMHYDIEPEETRQINQLVDSWKSKRLIKQLNNVIGSNAQTCTSGG